MFDTDSIFNNAPADHLPDEVHIPLSGNYILIWMDFSVSGFMTKWNRTYHYLRNHVDVSRNRFTDCTLCYNHILSLRERTEKIFVTITDPKQPMIQKDLFFLWSRLLIEPQVVKLYVVQTTFDWTFVRYWLSFKRYQRIYYIPNETLLLQQLRRTEVLHRKLICLNTGKNEISNIEDYGFDQLFSDAEQCFRYMMSNRRQPMVLVINSQNSNVFHYKRALSQLFSTKCYLYVCSALLAIHILTSSQTKQYCIREVDLFTDFVSFQRQLDYDLSPYSPFFLSDEWMDVGSTETLEMSLRSIETERFLYYTNIIAQLPQTKEAKDEMIEECRRYYHDPNHTHTIAEHSENRSMAKQIDRFVDEYYQKKEKSAIWWYTQDSFIYRRLNEACRTQDIDLMYTFRNFISDLFQQLQQLHSTFYDDMYGVPITVYRGQKISREEIIHLQKNVEKMYSTNTFLSASADDLLAKSFANLDDPCPGLESVLFEYKVDTSIETKRPYACIVCASSREDEQEVLFSMGTIFQVNSVEKITEDSTEPGRQYTYYQVKMTLVNEMNDKKLAPKMEEFEHQNRLIPTLLQLGRLAQKRSRVSNDFCKAERYFRLYLDEVLSSSDENDYRRQIEAYRSLANVCLAKGDYAAGIEYNETLIRIYSSVAHSPLLEQEEDEIINGMIAAYASIGITYQWRTMDSDRTIQTYQELLAFLQKQANTCPVCVTNTLHAIGNVYARQLRWSAALDYYRHAYDLNRDNLEYDRTRLDDCENQVRRRQNRSPEILFLLLMFIWCYGFSYRIVAIEEMVRSVLMPLSLIRFINYHAVHYFERTAPYTHQLYLGRFDCWVNKIHKKSGIVSLERCFQHLWDRVYVTIPPFTSLIKYDSSIFSSNIVLNRRAYSVIVALILSAAYLPDIFLLITRMVMIVFIVIWLSDLSVIHSISSLLAYNFCPNPIWFFTFAFIVLLELDCQRVARQKRPKYNWISSSCLKHSASINIGSY